MFRALAPTLLALLLLPAAAQARARTLAVSELSTPPNLLGIGARLANDIVTAASSQPGLVVLDPMQVSMTLGPEAMKRLKACEGKPACVAEQAGPLEADQLVVGRLDRNATHYLVKLFLIDLGTRRVVSSIDRAILIASRRLTRDVAEAIPRLLSGEAEASGRARIESSPSGATVLFDGEPAGTTPVTIEGKLGRHTVGLELEDHLPVERFVDIEAGETTTLEVRLTLRPGVKQARALAAATKEAGGASGTVVPLGTWISGGVGVAALGSGLYFGLQVRDANRKAVDADGDGALDLTRTEALAAKRNALIANVSFGVAGAAAVAAVLFTIFGGDGDELSSGTVSLQPSAGFSSGGATVGLGGTF